MVEGLDGMGSIDELREKMIAEARRKAEEIVRDAEEKAEEIVKKAEEEWSKKCSLKREEIISIMEAKARIIVSEARRKARIIISSKKYEVLEKVFNDAWNIIRERRGFSIEESLGNLLRESLQYIEEPETVYVNPVDTDAMAKILVENNLEGVKIVKDDGITGGLILVSKGGERIDNSYDTRFQRAKQVLAPMIAKILWG